MRDQLRMRCMRLSGRRRCGDGDAAAFCASLVEGLAHLASTMGAGGEGSVPMRWCADAMRLVKRMQREMLAIFRKADVGAAVSAGCCAGGWFEQYMQETAALLDLCNAFKAAVPRLHRYCMVLDFAAAAQAAGRAGGDVSFLLLAESDAHRAGWAKGRRGQAAAAAAPTVDREDKLSDVKAGVADEAERLGRTVTSGAGADAAGGMVVVTLVAKITTSVLSMFVLRALASPSPLDAGGGVRLALACAAVPELEPWRESLSLIHARFPAQATVAEREQVAVLAQDLISGEMDGGGHEVVRRHAELLRARSGELREGVEMFDGVLDEVFEEVIRGRNEMLGILRDKALT